MTTTRRHDRRRLGRWATAVAACAVWLVACGSPAGTPPPAAAPALPAAPAEAPDPNAAEAEPVPWVPGQWEPPPDGARPVEVALPIIGVNAPTPPLGLNDDDTLEVPSDYGHAGWYALGPRPGEPGPSVIAGHVDSRTGPAVFYRLDELRPGHLVHVLYDTGHVATFEVQGAEIVPKDAFPTARVYGETTQPELRLITCGGPFDRASGHYRDNLIVYATLLASWRYEA